MKNKDAISFSPQIHGFHEPRVKALIDDCADIGFNQFLIDITNIFQQDFELYKLKD
jgi:hypothetical protein